MQKRTGRPWDMDQEAVVPPAPPPPMPPPMSGLPGREPDLFLCAGARLVEKRPPVWELGRRAGAGAAARSSVLASSQTLSGLWSEQFSQYDYGTLHSLCTSLCLL